jgi:outer membrane protein assembly factor BamB
LSSTQFTEVEYAIRATNGATNCQTYYFRVTNAGSTTDFTFTVYPQITLAGSPACVAPVPITDLTITAYNTENTITWGNPAANYTHILVLAKTADCTFSTDPTGIETIDTVVGNGVVIFNNDPAVDMASTAVTVGGPTTVSYTAATSRLVHSGLTDGTLYCYKVYARNGDLLDDNSGSGRPSVTATGTDGVAPSAVWSFNLISSAGATLVQPSLDPGVSIYTSYGSGTLASMGATDGLLSWRATPASGAIQDQSAMVWMSGSSTCGLAGATNCIFATSQDGYIYARDATTGAAAWSYRHAAGDALQGAPAVQIKDYSNVGYAPLVDRLFAATRNPTTDANKVYALNPTVSPPTVEWLFTGGGANPAMDMVSSPPALDYDNNRIYVTSNSNGTNQRSLWVFDTVTGTLLSTGASYGGTALGDVAVAPALNITGSVVYVGTSAGALSAVYAYNTSDGSLRWSFLTASPVVSGLWVEWRAGLAGNIFFSTADGKVWRIRDDVTVATDLWGAGAPTITAASFVVVIPTAGKVYVGGCSGATCAAASEGKLYQLAVTTGTKEQCRSLGSNITVGDPAFDTVLERLLVGTSDGKVHAYAAPSGILGGDPSCTP